MVNLREVVAVVVEAAIEVEITVGEGIPIRTTVIPEGAVETTTDLSIGQVFRMEAKTTALLVKETKVSQIEEEDRTIKVGTHEATQTSGEINKITGAVITTTTEEVFSMQAQRIHITPEVDFNNEGRVSKIDQVVPKIFITNPKVVGTRAQVNQCRRHLIKTINLNQDSQISRVVIQTTGEVTISKLQTVSMAIIIPKEEVFKVKTIPEVASKETPGIIFRETPQHLNNPLRLHFNQQGASTSHLQQILSKVGTATMEERISPIPAKTTRILGVNSIHDHQAHKTASSTRIARTST